VTAGWEPNQTVFDGFFITDFQPRWVSVEIEWLQPAGHLTAVDNIQLTGRCVPEIPAALLCPLGLAALGLIRRRFVN
jgi:hypothetical protein